MSPSVKDFTIPMVTIKPFAIFRTRVIAALLGCLSLVGPGLLPVLPSQAAVIVLDPGHGGNDSGGGRGSEFAEKQFTLALAQKIATLLQARHRVELTRTADIHMAPADRAAVANHLRADLMISLHAAVAPYCSDRAAAIYYHNDERLKIPFGASSQGMPVQSDADRPEWNRLQIQHQHRSQNLAGTLKRSLDDSEAFDSVTISGVALAPLMGADLPAVLVEVGCMRPAAETNRQTREHQLDGYAASLGNAIETALISLVR
ncbi:N-acetylmuramoyl-L-alanine amidase [Desulfosarcina sp.]|uniref:N-acetylmuramoyl-L-alanine amidase family protein n=1 Tax=Desulfosarcina sp. TaxID=2027861 RepID=UPI003568B8B9